MHCRYFDAGACRSCRLMGVPYPRQLADKDAGVRRALQDFVGPDAWSHPFASSESGFRNKAKWVVGGSIWKPTIGILDGRLRGVDLRECGICEPLLRQAFPVLAEFVTSLGLQPYDVASRTGELKYLIVTVSPSGELMVRFVLRTDRDLVAIRAALPSICHALPQLVVLSVNLHPEHKAVVEGDREILLSARATLPMRMNQVTLQLGPQGFFQTNTAVAAGLYRQAAAWAAQVEPRSVLDLYCGVGGFALHCATESTVEIRGVEVSADAITAARQAARDIDRPERFSFVTADVTADPTADLDLGADLVIVNPPRRGIGAALADRLQSSTARHVLYSSCNVTTLAQDLARMPGLTVRRARLFDMFPQTTHQEVAVLLERS